jgi:hypothetical protein
VINHIRLRRNFVLSWIVLVCAIPAYAGMNRLQLAISMCEVKTAEKLLQSGADPNAKDAQGKPILKWLASSTKCDDVAALATAKVLDEHGAKFQSLEGLSGPSLLVNLAPRKLPTTLAFLSQRSGTGSATAALHAIARGNDLATIGVLLSAGADPLEGDALSSSLFDAAVSGQKQSVSEMLKHIQDKQSPKVLAAYEVAKKNGKQELAQVFLAAGVKPVKLESAPQEPSCKPQALTIAQAHLLSTLTGATECKFIQECGDLILMDCNSAADGPAYYINQKTAKILGTCGGACMRGCTNCPPKEWTCKCRF